METDEGLPLLEPLKPRALRCGVVLTNMEIDQLSAASELLNQALREATALSTFIAEGDEGE